MNGDTMKILELKEYENTKVNENSKQLANTVTFVGVCLNYIAARSGGLNVTEMSSRIDILNKAKKAWDTESRTLILEDKEASLLQTLVQNTKWVVVNEAIVRFSEEIRDMQTYEVNPHSQGKKS